MSTDEHCQHTPMGGARLGPTVGTPLYELAVNGDEHLFRAQVRVATWPDRVFNAATAAAPVSA